jgi:hypothetical protein
MSTQTEIAGVSERTALGKAANDFIEQKHRIEEESQKLEKLSEKIIEAMKEEKRRTFKFSADGETFEFAIFDVGEKLRCRKNPNQKR